MKKFALVIGLIACVGGAWAADSAVDSAVCDESVHQNPSTDGTWELSWDNGGSYWWSVWYTGADSWVANDFDVSTIKTYGGLKTMRVALRRDWPNVGWDGGRIGVFAFAGGVPGSMIWPTSGGAKFVVPTGAITGFQDFEVMWVLPGVKKFMAGWEQFYDSPNADSYGIDTNTVFMDHSWEYYGGSWSKFINENILPYRNLKIRMVVDNEQNPAVSPSSIGRVKALYY